MAGRYDADPRRHVEEERRYADQRRFVEGENDADADARRVEDVNRQETDPFLLPSYPPLQPHPPSHPPRTKTMTEMSLDERLKELESFGELGKRELGIGSWRGWWKCE